MRLSSLSLLAFGPFTAEVLDLSAPGLHVIYGPNEAGKSTALRAISGLLYGIPERTTDDHLHKKTALRIGGTIERSDGELLEVTRRKGRKNTLMDAAEQPLDEVVLERALAGVGRAQFETMFGLDHETLRQGGQALLRGEGDVGQSLFDAGGASGTGEVLRQLREEADTLFKATGKNPLLNKALADLKETKKLVEEQGTRPQGYVEQKQRLEEAEQEHAALLARRGELSTERNRLERALRVLPDLAKRRELLGQCERLGEVPRLPLDASDQRRRAQALLERAQADEQRIERELAALEQSAAGLTIAESLVALDEDRMKQLAERLGMHRKAAADLPKRLAELETREQEARRVLAELGRDEVALDAVDRMRLDKASEARLEALMDGHAGLLAKLEDARERRRRLDAKLTALREQHVAMQPPRDVTALRAALARATRAGDVEQAVARARAADGEARTALERAVAALDGYDGDVEAALSLAVPSRETVEAFAARDAALEQQSAALKQRRGELQSRSEATRAALAALDKSGEVPTEEQLASARGERQKAWAPLRTALKKGTQAETDGYEARVAEADGLADRLRREADRVAEHARLDADRDQQQRALEELNEEGISLDDKRGALTAEWDALWRALGVAARSPREMLPWLTRHVRALEQAGRCDAAASELGLREGELASARSAVAQQLEALGESVDADAPLSTLLDRGEALLARLDEASGKHRRLEEVIAERADELALLAGEQSESERALDAWQRDWKASTKGLGLAKGAGVAEARAVLKALRELFERVRQAEDTRGRVQGIERDARQFEADVAALVEVHGVDLTGRDAADAAEQLLARWRQAREQDRERARLAAEIEAKRAEHAEAARSREEAERVLSALMRDAKVETMDGLEQVERRLEQWRELQARIREAEDALLKAGDGAALDDLEEAVRELDVGRVRVDKEELDEQLEALSHEIDHAAQQVGSLKRGLASFEERHGAYAAKLDEQSQLAAIRHYAERYVRVRLAAVLLEREVERYRQQNQDPILARARQLFPKLTLGHYRDLKVGYDEGDEPELICLRGEDEVRVTGLSDGARDQLYLALRLASLERYADSSEMLPLVLDDILIHFDDDRASAALEALAQLAERSQILFFTHHARLRDLARKVVPQGQLHEHELPSPAAAKKAV